MSSPLNATNHRPAGSICLNIYKGGQVWKLHAKWQPQSLNHFHVSMLLPLHINNKFDAGFAPCECPPPTWFSGCWCLVDASLAFNMRKPHIWPPHRWLWLTPKFSNWQTSGLASIIGLQDYKHGIQQGYLPWPILYTLFTSDYVTSHRDKLDKLKLTDNSAVKGGVTGGDEIWWFDGVRATSSSST